MSNVKMQEAGEFVGSERCGCYRPEIHLESLNVEKIDKHDYYPATSDANNDEFCNFLKIPMKTTIKNDMAWQMMYTLLADYGGLSPETDDEGTFTNVQLDFIIDDNNGERKYYIGAFVSDTSAWDYDENNKCEQYVIVEINPNEDELTAINTVLNKIAA